MVIPEVLNPLLTAKLNILDSRCKDDELPKIDPREVDFRKDEIINIIKMQSIDPSSITRRMVEVRKLEKIERDARTQELISILDFINHIDFFLTVE